MYIVYAIIALSIAAIAHEFGHYYMAKRAGIEVEEFGIGLGPKIFSFKRGETTYYLKLIPFLGYVKIKGMDDNLDDPQGYFKKPLSKRFLTIFGGPLNNIILAIIIFFLLFSIFGDINHLSTKIEAVQENSPAHIAGIQKGDKILTINDVEIKQWDDVRTEIEKSNGEEIKIVVERENQILTFYLTPVKSEDRWIIGIVSGFEKVNIFDAFILSFKEVFNVIALFFYSLKLIFTGQAAGGIVGPIGIVQVASDIGKTAGIVGFIWFAAILNILLALTNLLPIPALDGGRIPFFIYELITKKKVPPEKENLVHFIGYIFLVGLLFVVTYFDIVRWIK
ncbi:MAG TPA: RIP metalloprotease RseP [Caldisericia bacterium]|nr:RIP metalloprotease RseP [Caldisericia bacterium]